MNQVFHNEIQRHIYSIPFLVTNTIEKIFALCAERLHSCMPSKLKQIVLTGCGYSYAAALAVKDALSELINMPVLVVPAVELARFTNSSIGDHYQTIGLIAISGSGAVSRVIEVMALYQNLGAFVIGMTGNMQSEMGKYANVLLDISTPDIGSVLPLRGYAMTFITLIATGWSIANYSGTKGTAKAEQIITATLEDMIQLQQRLPNLDREAIQFVTDHPTINAYEFVGSGYERAAAFLGKIEMMGQAGCMACDEDGEQWCHCNFFMANPEHIGTVLFYASRSPAASRTREVLQYMRYLQRPICVVTDDLQLTSDIDMQVFHLPDITAWNAGLLEMTVPSFLAGYVCQLLGETYSRGFRDRWSVFQDGSSTCESERCF